MSFTGTVHFAPSISVILVIMRLLFWLNARSHPIMYVPAMPQLQPLCIDRPLGSTRSRAVHICRALHLCMLHAPMKPKGNDKK